MHLNEHNEILAISGNHILLSEGAIAVIGNVKKTIAFDNNKQEIVLTTLCLYFGGSECDTFVFENDILFNYFIKENIAPVYVRDEIYSVLKPSTKIHLSIFIEELIELYVFNKMGFMDM